MWGEACNVKGAYLAPTTVHVERSPHAKRGAQLMAAEDLATGVLVQHVSLGTGKVIAVERNAIHVFFPKSDSRFAAKFRWPAAKPMFTADAPADAWLEGLSSFVLDAESGRYALPSRWMTHDQAIAEFLAAHPHALGGGEGDAPAGTRASAWQAARAEWRRTLGGGEGERLLASGDLNELVRRAVGVGKRAASIPRALDEDALVEAFQDQAAAGAFFEALFSLLSVPSPARARFEALFSAAAALEGAPAVAWPVATLFPFLAVPTRHAFLSPKTASAAAKRLGCDLGAEVAPTWAAYARFRRLSEQLLEKLATAGAKDFTDVEAFLHAVAGGPASADGAGAARKRPRAAKAAGTHAKRGAASPRSRS